MYSIIEAENKIYQLITYKYSYKYDNNIYQCYVNKNLEVVKVKINPLIKMDISNIWKVYNIDWEKYLEVSLSSTNMNAKYNKSIIITDMNFKPVKIKYKNPLSNIKGKVLWIWWFEINNIITDIEEIKSIDWWYELKIKTISNDLFIVNENFEEIKKIYK